MVKFVSFLFNRANGDTGHSDNWHKTPRPTP